MASLILIVALFALLWLLLIRPQRQKQATQQRLIDSVEATSEPTSTWIRNSFQERALAGYTRSGRCSSF